MMKKTLSICLMLIVAMAVMADEFTLVTDASILAAGDQIVLANSDKGLTATASIKTGKSANYLETVAATFSGQTVIPAATTAIFTLSGNAAAWTLTNQNGQVLGATDAKKLAWDNGTTTWTIASDGVSSTNSAYGTIQYNGSGSSRFCNYTGTLTKIQIYRKAGAPSVTYTLTYQGFTYMKTQCEEPAYAAGATIKLSSGTIQNTEGKWLCGWEYNGQTYKNGASFTMPEADVELIPVWGDEKPQAIENTKSVKNSGSKILRDGKLFIVMPNGNVYNVMGQRVK